MPRYTWADDRPVAAQVRAVIRDRATYGYRRVTALVNRACGTKYKPKRVRRVMARNGWTLPVRVRRRSGRAHPGRVARDGPNERWCSDSLLVPCTNVEVVEIGFVLDCYGRECLAALRQPRDLCGADIRALMGQAVAARFGEGRFGEGRATPPVQWLSDNEEVYTALETVIAAERVGLAPVTTPAYSPESNGTAEAFLKTLKRDYVDGADLSSAAAVLDQLPRWAADDNGVTSHSALGYLAPQQYRARQQV
ncbi:integrase [Gemmatimonadetes bacterium T265]|nr:integrase [Gemmatimonadetes bacterium T265]